MGIALRKDRRLDMEEPVLKYTSGTKGDHPLFGYRNNGHLKNWFSAQSTYFRVGKYEQYYRELQIRKSKNMVSKNLENGFNSVVE